MEGLKRMYKKPTQYEPQQDIQLQQKVDIQYLVLLQIQKCGASSYEGDDVKYSNACEQLLSMLPVENIKNIEAKKDEYITKIEQPTFKYFCGKQIGTLENPVYRNLKGQWNYDRYLNDGKPILVSPIVNEVEQMDYQKLFRLIMKELESIGVTWKSEPHDRVDKRVKKPNTPLVTLPDGSMVRVLIQDGISPEMRIIPETENSNEENSNEENSNEDDDLEDEQ